MAPSTPSPLQIIREELPRFLDEPHAVDFRETLSALVPQSPSELALEAAFAPISKPARLASLAASALMYSPDAEGAGALAKLALRSGPELRKWLDEAIQYAQRRRLHDSGEAERIDLDRKMRFAKGGLARHMESLGFTPEDAQYAMERFEEERQYLPHRGATNYESRPERYMIMAPHKIVPKEEWKYGSSVGGTHNFLEGIQVPNRSWNWVLPEVLTHEAQHANVGAMPLEEITSREEAQKGILSKLMEFIRPLHPAKYPAGVTGREKIEELAPELIAAEGYLPAGQSLIQSELGKRIFQSPEEKLWYMSRRYPRMRDPEVKGGYLDAITSAAPR